MDSAPPSITDSVHVYGDTIYLCLPADSEDASLHASFTMTLQSIRIVAKINKARLESPESLKAFIKDAIDQKIKDLRESPLYSAVLKADDADTPYGKAVQSTKDFNNRSIALLEKEKTNLDAVIEKISTLAHSTPSMPLHEAPEAGKARIDAYITKLPQWTQHILQSSGAEIYAKPEFALPLVNKSYFPLAFIIGGGQIIGQVTSRIYQSIFGKDGDQPRLLKPMRTLIQPVTTIAGMIGLDMLWKHQDSLATLFTDAGDGRSRLKSFKGMASSNPDNAFVITGSSQQQYVLPHEITHILEAQALKLSPAAADNAIISSKDNNFRAKTPREWMNLLFRLTPLYLQEKVGASGYKDHELPKEWTADVGARYFDLIIKGSSEEVASQRIQEEFPVHSQRFLEIVSICKDHSLRGTGATDPVLASRP